MKSDRSRTESPQTCSRNPLNIGEVRKRLTAPPISNLSPEADTRVMLRLLLRDWRYSSLHYAYLLRRKQTSGLCGTECRDRHFRVITALPDMGSETIG